MGSVKLCAPIPESHQEAEASRKGSPPRVRVASNPIKSQSVGRVSAILESPERRHVLGITAHAWFHSRQKKPEWSKVTEP